jgi:hypothetical protein
MHIHQNWRNKQLGQYFTKQEMLCLDFIKQHHTLEWSWFGNKGYFHNYATNFLKPTLKKHQGLIFISYHTRSSPKEMVKQINSLLHNNIKAAYLAINRYEFVPINDLDIDYKDDISDAIDQIVAFLHKPFKRIHHDIPNDNIHFVGTHGLDIFTYEDN